MAAYKYGARSKHPRVALPEEVVVTCTKKTDDCATHFVGAYVATGEFNDYPYYRRDAMSQSFNLAGIFDKGMISLGVAVSFLYRRPDGFWELVLSPKRYTSGEAKYVEIQHAIDAANDLKFRHQRGASKLRARSLVRADNPIGLDYASLNDDGIPSPTHVTVYNIF